VKRYLGGALNSRTGKLVHVEAFRKNSELFIALVEAGDRIVLHFLSPHSPESNVIERHWKQMHDHITRNHTHRTIDSLPEAVHEVLHGV
jgi:transposase